MATFLDDKDRADFLGLLDEFVEKERLAEAGLRPDDQPPEAENVGGSGS